MVLLSNLDVRGMGERDLSAEIADDLRRTIQEVPFSDVQVVRYGGTVRSDAEAAALAQASQAAVVIWGDGSAPAITLHVRVGDPDVFAGIPPEISAKLMHETADVDLRLDTSGELRSSALAVLTVLNVLKTASGDGYEILRVAALIDTLKNVVNPAEPLGGGTAPLFHRFLNRYYAQPDEARQVIDDALAADPANPLLLAYSGSLYQRLGQYEGGYEAAQAAADAVPNWAAPLYLLAIDRYVKGFPEQALAYLNEIVAARPGDSYALAYRGGFYYLSGYTDAAKADLQQAIDLGPKTALPYDYAAILALREGRLSDAAGLIRQVRERFSAQRSFDNNFYIHLFGQENLFGLTIAAIDQLLAGQNLKAVEYAQRALAFPENPILNDRLRGDLHFISGFAQCNGGDDGAANDSYSRALEYSPDFGLLYLLRADVRSRLGDLEGAQADLSAASSGPQAVQLQPFIQAAVAGNLTCKNLLQ
jgi:tetratricopeptide (TPR) repeat protein